MSSQFSEYSIQAMLPETGDDEMEGAYGVLHAALIRYFIHSNSDSTLLLLLLSPPPPLKTCMWSRWRRPRRR